MLSVVLRAPVSGNSGVVGGMRLGSSGALPARGK